MKEIIFANDADTVLLSGILAVDTSATVDTGDGALFPSPGANQVFRAKLYNAAGTYEIVYVTARVADVMTVERGKEGTAAQAWNAGDGFSLNATKETYEQLVQRNQLINGKFTYAADTGAANAYAVTLTEAPLAVAAGLEVWFKVANTNTGASTLNVNGLGAVAVKLSDGQATPAGVLVADAVVGCRHNGTEFRIVSHVGATVFSTPMSAMEALFSFRNFT